MLPQLLCVLTLVGSGNARDILRGDSCGVLALVTGEER